MGLVVFGEDDLGRMLVINGDVEQPSSLDHPPQLEEPGVRQVHDVGETDPQ